MATLPTITRYLALFHELYPTRDVTSLTAEAWEYALSDVGDQAFQWAADRVLREPDRLFFPTPNEIRRHLSREAVTRNGPTRIGAGDIDAALGAGFTAMTPEQRAEWETVKASLKGS